MDRELRTLLQDKADEVRLHGRIPEDVLRRSRRRRVANGALAGLTAAAIAAGIVVAGRAALTRTVGAPPEVAPGGVGQSGAASYPFIYPETQEVLEATQAEVAQGSMPMWTDPEGVAILFAVNVMGWDMDDVVVEADRETVTIRNPAVSETVRHKDGLPTTLHLFEVPGADPPVYAVLAAVTEVMRLEPLGPDDHVGEDGTIGFRGNLGFVPEGARITLTIDAEPPVSVQVPDGAFEIQAPLGGPLGPSTLISVALQDGSGNTIALTSSRLATPVAGGSEGGASEPQLAVPPPVAATREAILAAARARDFDALRGLIPDEGFTFSFGGETDPIRYWKRLESRDHVPVIGDILPAVLETDPGFERGVFVWPTQATEDPARWDPADIEALAGIHAEEDVRAFQEAGLYYGWRLGIDRNGTWVFFVAGD